MTERINGRTEPNDYQQKILIMLTNWHNATIDAGELRSDSCVLLRFLHIDIPSDYTEIFNVVSHSKKLRRPREWECNR